MRQEALSAALLVMAASLLTVALGPDAYQAGSGV